MSREEALRLYTQGSSWFSTEEDVKGSLAPGQLADFAVLTSDFFSAPEEEIKQLQSVLTVVGGEVVYAAEDFTQLAPPPLPAALDWAPDGPLRRLLQAWVAGRSDDPPRMFQSPCLGRFARLWTPSGSRFGDWAAIASLSEALNATGPPQEPEGRG